MAKFIENVKLLSHLLQISLDFLLVDFLCWLILFEIKKETEKLIIIKWKFID